MARLSHESGTDHIAETVESINCDIIINVQGDGAFIKPELIEKIAVTFEDIEVNMVSAMHRLYIVDELKNSNVVKVTVDKNYNALYFSRSIIPHHRDDWNSLLNHHKIVLQP